MRIESQTKEKLTLAKRSFWTIFETRSVLIFKNNIHNRNEMGPAALFPTPDIEYDARFNPLHLIEVALKEEDELLDFLERQPKEY